MDPPPCVQNAMMTKDKKPFTYTPGGIDLSEIKSPRMARRIERNANAGGVCEAPRAPPPPPQNLGPLPPSTLAVMRPQPQVQVFPGPPPPPPMQPKNMPPPPPPPMQPLPTQKVTTSDNQVLERPDMTKIIPENPIALLRKTGGPAPRNNFLDEVYAQEKKNIPQPQSAPSNYQTPVIGREPVVFQPVQQQNQQQTYQPPLQQQQYQPIQKSPEQPRYQPPVIERQQSITRPNDQPVKTSTAHLGSLYIPPANQQQTQQKSASPPTPPERQQIQSPGTPTLKEAPKPWQTKTHQQQQELPPWARRDEPAEKDQLQNIHQKPQSPPTAQQQRWQQVQPPSANQQQKQMNVYETQPSPQRSPNMQQRWQTQQSPPIQQQQQRSPQPNTVPVHIEIRTNMRPVPPYQQQPAGQYEPEERKPEAVYISQPIVLQHPGSRIGPSNQTQQAPRPQVQQQPRLDTQGARIIPIQIEGRTPPTPGTPGSERSLNRQQSWGNNPPQSNSFKVIQKITQTDDDEDEDTPITQHSPRYPQNFQQVPADQVRRMKLNEADRDLMNRFKQGVDDDLLQREVDPRYRGAAIPSKAFKLLQNMTGGAPDVHDNFSETSVPQQGPQQTNKGQIRTIPVQVEGNGVPQKYVHPSEQVVPEPKKYTGSSIPSRSFKMLQAMTAPESCANANDNEENSCDPNIPSFDPNFPMFYPPPYWYEYYQNFFYQQQSELSKNESSEKSKDSGRSTPLPYWGYGPTYPYPVFQPRCELKNSNDTSNPRSTPIPFCGNPYGNFRNSTEDNYLPYPPYVDPYYFYYYGYPPMMSPYPFYGNSSDNEDVNGYSSTDEMMKYMRSSERSNNINTEINKRKYNMKETSTKTSSSITPTNQEPVEEKISDVDSDSSDSETENEQNDEPQKDFILLQSIKSVPNINVYADEDSQCSEDDDHSVSHDGSEDDFSLSAIEDEIVPHQLSVIDEESERTDSRQIRPNSVLSDSTTIADKSESEDEDEAIESINNKSLKFSVCIAKENADYTIVTVDKNEVKSFHEPEICSKNDRHLTAVIKSFANSDDKTTRNSTSTIENNNIIEKMNLEDDRKEKKRDDKDSDEDWWSVIGKEDGTLKPMKAENKPTATKQEPKKIAENVKTYVESVYDKMKEDENEEKESGRLMEVESFVEKLEQIKRASGLWNQEISTTDVKVNDDGEGSRNSYEEESDESDIDFWSQIKRDEDEFIPRKSLFLNRNENEEDSSASSSNSSFSKSISSRVEKEEATEMDKCFDREESDEEQLIEDVELGNNDNLEIKTENEVSENEEENMISATVEQPQEQDESSQSDSSSSEEEPDREPEQISNNVINENEVKTMTIKERIRALKESINQKQKLIESKGKTELKMPVTHVIPEEKKEEKRDEKEVVSDNKSKNNSTKSSVKSFEEFSEEEGDSGVLSDLSRHISETEEFSELRKLTRYQRAATHSRLFKLLQEQCENEDDSNEEEVEEDTKSYQREENINFSKQVQSNKDLFPSRSQLSLPLNKFNVATKDSTLNDSPVNEKLVDELVQSLLNQKKGQIFKDMPREKLYAAALRILQEDMESTETPSEDFSSLLSPLRADTQSSTPIQTPQEFYGNYNDYKQYYESWGDAERMYNENYDILPSKAFKLLQEHLGSSKIGAIEGLLAKCPRILSSKNVHKELMKILDGDSDCSSPSPEKTLQSNEVTNTS